MTFEGSAQQPCNLSRRHLRPSCLRIQFPEARFLESRQTVRLSSFGVRARHLSTRLDLIRQANFCSAPEIPEMFYCLMAAIFFRSLRKQTRASNRIFATAGRQDFSSAPQIPRKFSRWDPKTIPRDRLNPNRSTRVFFRNGDAWNGRPTFRAEPAQPRAWNFLLARETPQIQIRIGANGPVPTLPAARKWKFPQRDTRSGRLCCTAGGSPILAWISSPTYPKTSRRKFKLSKCRTLACGFN